MSKAEHSAAIYFPDLRTSRKGTTLRFSDLTIDDNRDSAANVRYKVTVQSAKPVPSVFELNPGMPIPLEIAGEDPVRVQILRRSPAWPTLTVTVEVQEINGVPMVVEIDRGNVSR